MPENHLPALAAILLLSTTGVTQQKPTPIRGRVLDAARQPVVDIEVAKMAMTRQGKLELMSALRTSRTGEFTVHLPFFGYAKGKGLSLIVADRERRNGAVCTVYEKDAADRVELVLAPFVNVRGRLVNDLIGDAMPGTGVSWAPAGGMPVNRAMTKRGCFEVLLPPGPYDFTGYGPNLRFLKKRIEIPAGKEVCDLGKLLMEPTKIARLWGKEAPSIVASDARGISPTFQARDIRGKWLLLELFTYT